MRRDSFLRLERSRQRGMTLIELLVGLTLGLLVVLAAVASLTIVRGSSRTVSDSTTLEQQATFAMLQIGQQLSQTGAYNAFVSDISAGGPDAGVRDSGVTFDPSAAGDILIQFDTRPIGVAADAPLSTLAIFGQDGADGAPDTLYISYSVANDGSPSTGCAGLQTGGLDSATHPLVAQYGPAARSVSIFSVDTRTRSLTCDTDPPSNNALPIAANVADMRVSYLSIDAEGNAKSYKNAAAVNNVTNTTWATINGVQICLELVGDTAQTVPPTFKDCQDQDKPANGRIHRIVRNTFYLRNPLQTS